MRVQETLGVSKLMLRNLAWNCLNDLFASSAKSGSITAAAASRVQPAALFVEKAIMVTKHEPGLAELETGFACERQTWFDDARGLPPATSTVVQHNRLPVVGPMSQDVSAQAHSPGH